MQLVQLSNKLKPITIAASLLHATTSYSYSDIDAYSNILSIASNNKTSEYIKIVDKNDNSFYLQKFKFENHLIN